jgi:hypothetical protein
LDDAAQHVGQGTAFLGRSPLDLAAKLLGQAQNDLLLFAVFVSHAE